MNSVTLVARRRGQLWMGALAIDNDFQDVVQDVEVDSLIEHNIVPALDMIDWAEGDRLQITVSIVRAK